MNTDEILRKRFIELADRAYSQSTYAHSDFLSPYEQDLFLRTKKDMPPVSASLRGENSSSVRKIAVFGSREEFGYEMEDPTCAVHIEPASVRFAEELTHRDYLGALLSLGIDRGKTGDIVIRGREAWIWVLRPIAPFICDHLLKVRHTDVICHICEDDIPELTPHFETIHANVQSERADLLLECVTKENRDYSKRLIDAEKVFVNGRLLTSPAHKLKAGDEIVVRGYGKYIYDGILSTTRKNRINVTLRRYC